MPTRKLRKSSDGLEGRFFHTFTADKKLHYQGHVLKRVSDEFYLVEFFSWLSGDPTYQQLVSLKKMSDWWFYSSAADMRHSSEEGPHLGGVTLGRNRMQISPPGPMKMKANQALQPTRMLGTSPACAGSGAEHTRG